MGMMIQVNFTGATGTRYAPAYGNATCRATETCTPPLIDPTCYTNSLAGVKPPVLLGMRVGKCPPPSPPPPPNAFVLMAATATAEATTATAEATTWKVTAIVLGVVLAVVLLLVAAVFLAHLAMRVTPGTANTGGAASSGGAGGTELM